MERTPAEPATGAERLEPYLEVLANSRRLELLGLLRTPRTLDEIHLTAGDVEEGRPERPLTRQGVQNHLDRLVEAGLVRVRPTERRGKRILLEYVVDHSRVFALLEELRALATLESRVPLDPQLTQRLEAVPEQSSADGPKLVLVHGLREGRAFPLLPSQLGGGRGWIVGRAAEAHVRLDYDPFVSNENAEVLRDHEGFRLLDLRSARNGTYLNWRRIPLGGEVPLREGDVVGVGKSLLVFREG